MKGTELGGEKMTDFTFTKEQEIFEKLLRILVREILLQKKGKQMKSERFQTRRARATTIELVLSRLDRNK